MTQSKTVGAKAPVRVYVRDIAAHVPCRGGFLRFKRARQGKPYLTMDEEGIKTMARCLTSGDMYWAFRRLVNDDAEATNRLHLSIIRLARGDKRKPFPKDYGSRLTFIWAHALAAGINGAYGE